jgi:hypothetical protein
MTKIKLTQKNFDNLVNYMNHKMTETSREVLNLNTKINKLDYDLKWIKKIMTIQTTLLTGLFLALCGMVIKTI